MAQRYGTSSRLCVDYDFTEVMETFVTLDANYLSARRNPRVFIRRHRAYEKKDLICVMKFFQSTEVSPRRRYCLAL